MYSEKVRYRKVRRRITADCAFVVRKLRAGRYVILTDDEAVLTFADIDALEAFVERSLEEPLTAA